MMNWQIIFALLVATFLCGCQKEYDPLRGRQVTAIRFIDVKLQTHSEVTEPKVIGRVTSTLAQFNNNWRKYWVTLPMNFGSITFYEGTNEIGTLFIGHEWISFDGKIRTTSREELAQLWETVSEKGNAQPAGGAYVSPAAGDPSAHP